MGLIDSITFCLKNLFNFKERATRSEFWCFYIFTFLIVVGICCILGIDYFAMVIATIFGAKIIEFYIITFILFLLNLSVSIRRLNDIDWNPGWVVVYLIWPIIVEYYSFYGLIAILVYWGLMLWPSDIGDNGHGYRRGHEGDDYL